MRVSKKTVFTYLAFTVINIFVFYSMYVIPSESFVRNGYVFSNIVYGVTYGILSRIISKKILWPNIILFVSFGIIGPILASEFDLIFKYNIVFWVLLALETTGIVLVASLLSSAAVSLIIRLTRFIKHKKETKEQ